MTGIEQQKATGTVSIFSVARVKAGLAHQCGLLVTESAAKRYAGAQRTVFQRRSPGFAVTGWNDAGQNLTGYPQYLKNFFIPIQGMQIHQHGAAGIGYIGDMGPFSGSAGKPPDDPGFHGPEQGLTFIGRSAGPVIVVQNPFDFRTGKIGGNG